MIKFKFKKKIISSWVNRKIIINLKYDLYGRNIVFVYIDFIIVCVEYDIIYNLYINDCFFFFIIKI